jgi:hypothetical protein
LKADLDAKAWAHTQVCAHKERLGTELILKEDKIAELDKQKQEENER